MGQAAHGGRGSAQTADRAAAKEWGAPPQSCSVADGYVVFTSRRKSFGELAEAAAALPKPENVQLKGRNEFKYIGKPQQRLDTPAKVDGSAQFGIDVRLPGMLYAALAQPPELGAQRQELQGRRSAGRCPACATWCRRRPASR